jgi:type VI secretion system secreted protein VgrG
MAISAAARPLRIVIGSLDADRVLLTRLKGREAISELFHFDLELAVEADKPLDFAQVLGQPTTITFQTGNAAARTVKGILSKLRQVRKGGRFLTYTAEFVPPLWRRSIDLDSDVFQQMTTKAIIEQVLKPLAPAQDLTFKLAKTYFPRNFCARYRESTVNFMSRLMEDEGMWYFFDHAGEKPELVIADSAQGRRKLPDGDTLEFREMQTGQGEADLIGTWEKSQTLTATSVVFVDHHFLKPRERFSAVEIPKGTVQVGTVSHSSNPDGLVSPVLDCPGGFSHWRDDIAQNGSERQDFEKVFDDARRLGQVEADRIQSLELVIEGSGTVARLCPGFVFKLDGHFDADGEYLLTSVEHTAACAAAENGSAVNPTYANTFTCIPAGLEFKPQYETVKPFIAGTQTAIVAGTDGEEIDPDKFGRVKVQFRWDNRPFTEKKGMQLESSCWVRVAQQWAGKKFGFQFLPRIGDEVIVAFEEGDPDKPLIIGSVYNAENEPTYDLPKHKTQSGIKTRSSKEGTPANFNEIKFEDKKGAEFVSFHAEKDMFTHVENLHTITVGSTAESSGSDTKTTGTMTTVVFGDTSLTVSKGDYAEAIKEGTHTTTVKGDTSLTVQSGNYNMDVQTGSSTTHVKGNVIENYDAKQQTTTGDAQIVHVKSGGQFDTVDSGVAQLIVKGGNRIVDVTGTYQVTASDKIILKCGSSSLTLQSDGTIILDGVKVNVQGSTNVKSIGGGASTKWEGKAITEAGPSGIDIGGGPVKISGATVDITGSPVKVNS